MEPDHQHIVVIGASAGGIQACRQLLATFKEDLNAAVFIVIHMGPESMAGIILKNFRELCPLPCIIPEDGEKIESNKVYLAPADYHMILNKGYVTIARGAYENHWRPAIDVLFRSAAAAYDSCVAGIILTGLLDDGTSGMGAIKKSGGICMVQRPSEAEFPDMPVSVLNAVQVDYEASIGEMGYILTDLFARAACIPGKPPEQVLLEARIANRMSTDLSDTENLGQHTALTCPDCGGALFKIDDGITRYRCYTGHAFTRHILQEQQIKGIEESLWVAIRMLEERRNLLNQLSGQHQDGSREERAGQIRIHIQRLKNMLKEIGSVR